MTPDCEGQNILQLDESREDTQHCGKIHTTLVSPFNTLMSEQQKLWLGHTRLES